MRMGNNIWIWILVADTCALAGGIPRLGMGSALIQAAFWEAQPPHSFLAPPHTPHVQAQRVWGLQYMKLTSCYDKYCKRVGAEDPKIAWEMYDPFAGNMGLMYCLGKQGKSSPQTQNWCHMWDSNSRI